MVFVGPYEHHSNELPWRESIADVVTIREDGDGRVDLDHLEEELRALRSATAEDRQLLGRVERDGDRHRRRAASRSSCTATARSPCWDYAAAGPYLPIDMNPSPAVRRRPPRLQGRGLRLAAQVRRRARHARRPRREARAVPQSRPDRARRRHDPVRQPDGADVPPRRRRSARRAARPRSSSRSAPGSSSRSRRRSASSEIRRREHDFARRALDSWRANPRIEILGNPDARAARDRLARPPAPARAAALALRRRRSSTTCSGSRRAAAASAPARTSTASTRSTTGWSARMEPQAALGNLGAKLSLVRLGFNYFTSEAVLRLRRRAPSTSSPTRAGSCCRCTASTRRAGSGTTGAGGRCRRSALDDVSFASGGLERPQEALRRPPAERSPATSRKRGGSSRELEASPPTTPPPPPSLPDEFERARWFPLPHEAFHDLRRNGAPTISGRRRRATAPARFDPAGRLRA